MNSDPTPPLRQRVKSKLNANILGMGLNVLSQSMVARGLGPEAVGNFGFLTNFFNQAIGFFEAGTSLGFYSKLSMRPKEEGIVRFYWGFSFMVGGALAVGVLLSGAVGGRSLFWPGQSTSHIAGVFALCFVLSLGQILNFMVDGHGLTVEGEKSRNIQRVVGVGALMALFWNGFSLGQYIALNLLLAVFLGWLWKRNLNQKGIRIWPRAALRSDERWAYAREFWGYGVPLAAYSIMGSLCNIWDRWLLQKYSGSGQQGFFSFSFQVAGVAAVFGASLTPLMMRELSVAFGRKDMDGMRHLFIRSADLLFGIASILGAYLFLEASWLVKIFGGARFQDALGAWRVMMFYPLYQCLGQLCGSVFYATGNTRIYRNLGIVSFLMGLPVSFFLLAPSSLGGVNAGALGLALKTVVANFMGVNLMLFFISRDWKVSILRFLGTQMRALLVCAALAAFAAMTVPDKEGIIGVGIRGLVYGGGVLLVMWKRSEWVGIPREYVPGKIIL